MSEDETVVGRVEVRATNKRVAKKRAKRKIKKEHRGIKKVKIGNVFDLGNGFLGKKGFNRFGVHFKGVVPSKDAKRKIERISGKRVVREKKDEGVEVVSW